MEVSCTPNLTFSASINFGRPKFIRSKSSDYSCYGLPHCFLSEPDVGLVRLDPRGKIAASGLAHWRFAEALRAKKAVQIPAPTFARGCAPDALDCAQDFRAIQGFKGFRGIKAVPPTDFPHIYSTIP